MKVFIGFLIALSACSTSFADAISDGFCIQGSPAGCVIKVSNAGPRTCDQGCSANETCFGGFCIDRTKLARSEDTLQSFTVNLSEEAGQIIPARVECVRIGKALICNETKDSELLQRQDDRTNNGIDI